MATTTMTETEARALALAEIQSSDRVAIAFSYISTNGEHRTMTAEYLDFSGRYEPHSMAADAFEWCDDPDADEILSADGLYRNTVSMAMTELDYAEYLLNMEPIDSVNYRVTRAKGEWLCELTKRMIEHADNHRVNYRGTQVMSISRWDC